MTRIRNPIIIKFWRLIQQRLKVVLALKVYIDQSHRYRRMSGAFSELGEAISQQPV